MATQIGREVRFNLNDKVSVKLTPRGREILRENHDDFNRKLSEIDMETFEYKPPKEDDDGWSIWQMHGLFESFGSHIHFGSTVFPFELNIRIHI